MIVPTHFVKVKKSHVKQGLYSYSRYYLRHFTRKLLAVKQCYQVFGIIDYNNFFIKFSRGKNKKDDYGNIELQ